MPILLTFAWVAGVVTILSPCILPILPILLSSAVAGGRRRPWGIITGFVVSFTLFTLFLASLVKLTGLPGEYLRPLAAAVLMGFGLVMVIPGLQRGWERWAGRLLNHSGGGKRGEGFGGGMMVGLSLGLVWAPCVGPILAGVITLAATSTVTAGALLITLAYSLGTAIPMLLILKGGSWLSGALPVIRQNSRLIQQAFGCLMILAAAAIMFGWDRQFQVWVLDRFPSWGTNLTRFEDNPAVRQQLDQVLRSEEERGIDTAPGFEGGGNWLNSQPLTLQELKGRVVLVDFWTYTCINCIRTLPYLKAWHEAYAPAGLVIVGVHTPEFEFEKDTANVSQAAADFGLTYPIVQDNDFAIWKAYRNRYWPAKYLLDKDGVVRYTHFGEGAYAETEAKIRELLRESTGAVELPKADEVQAEENQARTQETYLGWERMAGLAAPQRVSRDETKDYEYPARINRSRFGFDGRWTVRSEYAEAGEGAGLKYRFDAREVNLVMRPVGGGGRVTVKLDGQEIQTLQVNQDKLYQLVTLDRGGEHELELVFPEGRVQAFAFTFG